VLKRLSVIVAVLASLVACSAAQAQQYPPASNVLSVDVQVGPNCRVTYRVVARTYRPGTTVTFTLFSDPVRLGSAIADGSGTATLERTFPVKTTPGTHIVQSSGTAPDGSPLTVESTIRVGCNDSAPLARTGSDLAGPLTRVGIAAVAAGALAVLVARKRRANSVTA